MMFTFSSLFLLKFNAKKMCEQSAVFFMRRVRALEMKK